MSRFNVRCVDTDSSLQISVEYAPTGGSASRIFNACRPKIENVETSLTRLAQNINKHFSKKKKKKDSDIKEVTVELYETDGVTKICDPVSAEDGFSHGNIVQILDSKYTVDVNGPCCLGIVIPQSVMVGFPLYPKVNAEFCNLDNSEFMWEKIKYRADNTAENSKSRKQNSSIIEERKEICRTLSYTPTNDDIGYCLAFTCIPKSGERSGKSFTVEAKHEVTAGPGLCPFETRHLYTQKETEQNEYVYIYVRKV
jgi:2',5'-phosphodiesterase